MSYKNIVAPETFEALRELVRRTFPDPKAPAPSDPFMDAVIGALPEGARAVVGVAKDVVVPVAVDALEELAKAKGEARGLAQEDARLTATYYLAFATHTRHDRGAHEFTGRLPMVRVLLPESKPTDFETHFGFVFAGDHKVHTVELVRDKYREFFSFEIGSVALTTPARFMGARFGAIATYEVFDTDKKLRAWILEAGMATGEAMVLYASPHGQPIERVSWYQPTPFSSPNNWYRGAATFDDRGPATLHVQVSTPEERAQKQVHTEVSVIYDRLTLPVASPTFPAKLTAEAAMRVAAIAVARGDKNPLFLALAPFGHALEWSKRP